MKSRVTIQPSFVLSYLAVGVLAVTTLLLNNLSLPAIEADTSISAQYRPCSSNSPVFKGESALTDQEKLNFGDGAKAWVFKRRSVREDEEKTFRIILGVREISSAGTGGMVEFTVALGNLNDDSYSEDEGRVWLWIEGETTPLDFLYDTDNSLNLQANKYWVGKRNLLVEDYEGVTINFELLTGDEKNSRGCVVEALDLKEAFGLADTTVTPTATSSSTATTSASATISPSATLTSSSSDIVQVWGIKSGFSAWVVPDDYDALDGKSILDAGMYVYQFNYSGSETWEIYSAGSTLPVMYPGVGYYIYNPNEDASVNLSKAATVPESSARVIKKGWNLMANSSSKELKLSDVTYTVVKSGYDSCQESDSLCSDKISLADLLSSKRTYGKIYVIKDETATSATSAFKVLDVTEENIDSTEISGQTAYWVYLYK
jgi:hypothetical protein